jgi:hypothetical protein
VRACVFLNLILKLLHGWKDFPLSLAKYQAKKAPIEDEPVLGLQARLRSGKTTEIHILLPVSEGRRNKDAY